MWHQEGFLADAFQVFKQHGMFVDLVSTSETNVTVSLDPAANTLDNTQVAALVADLSRLCRVQVIGPCASVSLVGRNIRAVLHQLRGTFEFFTHAAGVSSRSTQRNRSAPRSALAGATQAEPFS